MGGGKLFSLLAGKPLLRWAAEAADRAGFQTRIMVVSSVSAADHGLTNEGWSIVINPEAETGLASSIRVAAAHAGRRERLVLGLADMPFVSPAHLRTIALSDGVIFTRYPSGRSGVPAGFDQRDLARLMTLQGDAGAAAIEWKHAKSILPPSDNELIDVDTPANLMEARRLVQQS